MLVIGNMVLLLITLLYSFSSIAAGETVSSLLGS